MKYYYPWFFKIIFKLLIVDVISFLILALTSIFLYTFPQLTSIFRILLVFKSPLSTIGTWSLIIFLSCNIILILLLTYEIIKRANRENDSILNLISSFKITYQLRYYLSDNKKSAEKNNADTRSFNKYVTNLVVNITENEVMIFIPDATKIATDERFKSQKQLLEDKIGRLLPKFMFSPFDTDEKYFILKGSIQESNEHGF